MRIQRLAIEIANQIAAGEVIERPASVVKELLENALDAKATALVIDIGFGGLNEIKISDNGIGIIAEDLPLAIAPHATSKIKCLDDLYALTSMGFRGEALASIASVSRVSIRSKPHAQNHGMEISKIDDNYQLSSCAHNQGTTVCVRDIFYNAPVRKKFLKSEKYEFHAIDQVVRRFALAAPHVALQFSHNGKLQLALPAATNEKIRQLRVKRLFGTLFFDQALALSFNEAGVKLQGWVSALSYQRSQNDRLWVYLNGRMIKDRLVNNAIHQAYDTLLDPGKHPACLIYIEIDPAEVDVNVHPTKHEVRFHQPRLIHDLLIRALNTCLQKATTEPKTQEYVIQQKSIFVEEPLYKSISQEKKAEEITWFHLNSHYSIFKIEGQAYFLDYHTLKKCHLRSQLSPCNLPLRSRPLLVPFRFIRDQKNKNDAKILHLLQQYGFDAVESSTQIVLIKTIPILLPQLNLNHFFKAYFQLENYQHEEIIDLLISFHEQTPPSSKAEEMDTLSAFIQQQISTHQPLSWGILLDEKRCRELLDV